MPLLPLSHEQVSCTYPQMVGPNGAVLSAVGYVVDLVSTLFVEIEELAEQARAFGGTRFHRNLFSKMILNVQDEWIPKASKILLRIVDLVNFQR